MGIMAMEWLAVLIGIVAVIAAIVFWTSARFAESREGVTDGTAETPNGEKPPAEFLRFHPPSQDDVFQCSSYYSALARKRMLIWDYRDKRGNLHSGVAPTLEQATEAASEFGYSPANGNHNNSRTA